MGKLSQPLTAVLTATCNDCSETSHERTLHAVNSKRTTLEENPIIYGRNRHEYINILLIENTDVLIYVCSNSVQSTSPRPVQLEHPMFSATFAGGEHECRLPATCCKPCSARVCQSLGCQQELRMHHSG